MAWLLNSHPVVWSFKAQTGGEGNRAQTSYCLTMDTDEIQAPHTMRGMACKFFIAFALFEFAMKETDFLTPKGRHHHAEPDWCALMQNEEIKQLFESSSTDEEFQAAKTYYETHPPMQQVVKDKRLAFDHASTENNAAKNILNSVKRTRNNLFHGGKFKAGPVGDGDAKRSIELMRHGLVILRKCLDIPSLAPTKNAYENASGYFLNG